MYRIQHILSELNLDHADNEVTEFSSIFTHYTKADELYFSHVKEYLDAREELPMDDDILLPTQTEVARDRMLRTIREHYKGYSATKTKLLVEEGNPLKFLRRQVEEHEIDLVIIGREPHSPTARRLPVQLTRKVPCSVLIVPEDAEARITSIIVPVDFSHHSKDAVEEAIALAIASKQEEITLLHVFRLPSGYSKNGKCEDEFCQAMRKNAMEEYEFFIEKVDLRGIGVTFHISHSEDLVAGILNEIKRQQGDMVVVGARGRRTGAGVFMGSITEDLIARSPVPVLAVKEKARGMSFYEALLRL